MYPCRAVGLDFVEHAPHRFVAEVTVHATPAEVFEVFEDAGSWPVWALPIQHVEWTSPRPFGVGTTRTVTMTGGLVGKEEFIAWERGRRMAFRFTETSMDTLHAFAEDYQVTDLGNGRSHVRWVMAMEPKGANAVVLRLFGWALGFGLRWMFGRFGRYVDGRYPVARAA